MIIVVVLVVVVVVVVLCQKGQLLISVPLLGEARSNNSSNDKDKSNRFAFSFDALSDDDHLFCQSVQAG